MCPPQPATMGKNHIGVTPGSYTLPPVYVCCHKLSRVSPRMSHMPPTGKKYVIMAFNYVDMSGFVCSTSTRSCWLQQGTHCTVYRFTRLYATGGPVIFLPYLLMCIRLLFLLFILSFNYFCSRCYDWFSQLLAMQELVFQMIPVCFSYY